MLSILTVRESPIASDPAQCFGVCHVLLINFEAAACVLGFRSAVEKRIPRGLKARLIVNL